MNVNSKAEKILRDLNFEFGTFSIEGFLRFIGQAKGREILSIPCDLPNTLFGAWISNAQEPKEYIFYRNDVSEIHQVHIQLHEVSHLLLGHPTLQVTRELIIDFLSGRIEFPTSDLSCLRSPKKVDLEIEAETLVNLIQKNVVRSAGINQLTHSVSSEKRFANLLETMGLI